MAWDHELTAGQIAKEWVSMTFSVDERTASTVEGLMMKSHEAFVSYSMPLGLHHLIGGDHYAPMPWNDRAPRRDWTAVYYHRAGKDGLGLDRTRKGNRAVEQYFPPVCEVFDRLGECPEKFLLWFHRCAWDYRMRSGRTLWEELCRKYQEGAAEAGAMEATWQSLAGRIDARRHREVAERLAVQARDAAQWRDRILEYFQGFSGQPIAGGAGASVGKT